MKPTASKAFLTKNQATLAFRAATAFGSRAIPTLGSILKFSAVKFLLTPSVTASETENTMVQAAAEKIDNTATGQSVIKDVAAINKQLTELMAGDSGIVDTGIRITKADLPRLPEWSDDEKKQEKYDAARKDLANLIADLGPLFDHEEPQAKS